MEKQKAEIQDLLNHTSVRLSAPAAQCSLPLAQRTAWQPSLICS